MEPGDLAETTEDDGRARSLTDLPVDRPVATLMLLIALMVLGVVAVFRLPLDFLPQVERPFVQVTVPYRGSHPLETLRQITEPLEGEIATIPDLREMNSDSGANETRIWANFDWSVDIDLKKMEVREAVERIRPTLPTGIGRISYESHWGGPSDGTILQGRISAKRDLSESYELLDNRIRRPLERISGVAKVELGGVLPPQVFIDIDLDACRRHGLSPQQIIEQVQAANLDLDLGAIGSSTLRYNIRTESRFKSVDEIAGLPLAPPAAPNEDGSPGASSPPIHLSDVANVELREGEIDYGRHLDREFAVSIDVFKEPTANTVATVDRLMEKVAEIERDPDLNGVKLLVWKNAGQEIRNSINNLRDAGIFGGILAIIVLLLFLRRIQTTLIVAVAIPFSLIVTCGAMFLLDAQLNVLTMLGLMLGVGMLVDNAVVVIENIYRLQTQGLSPKEAARKGARQVAMAVLASTATSIIVWAWLFVADRDEMAVYLGSVALTICLAVTCSLLISLTFIPMAAARIAPPKGADSSFLIRRVVPVYRRILRFTLRHRLATLILLLGLAGSAWYPIDNIEKQGEPTQQREFLTIRYEVHTATDLAGMEAIIDQVEAVIEPHKEALGYTSLYSWYQESGWLMTRLYLPPHLANDKAISELKDRLRPLLPTIAGVKLNLSERRWWQQRSQGNWVRLNISGEDPEYLRELATEVENLVRAQPDVHEAHGPSVGGRQEARILVDPEKARALGVSPRAVAETVAFTFRGRGMRRFQTDDGELEMRMGLPEDATPGMAGLMDLPVATRTGTTVPLSSVAEVMISRIDHEINREERQTTAHVGIEYDESITREVGMERMTQLMNGVAMPDGYTWSFGSWGRRHQGGLDTMTQGVALSLMGVILLMAALFESFAQPLAIVITLPLAFFGAFWALWMGDYTLDMVAFMGVIILIGIVVNNGIVMVDHVNQLRDRGMDRVEALVTGCGDRLRPVLMTAITTIFGMVPLGMSQFTISSIFIDSLAVVVIGGLATSTFFTLLALPVWYATLEDIGDVLRRAWPRRKRTPGPLPPQAALLNLQAKAEHP